LFDAVGKEASISFLKKRNKKLLLIASERRGRSEPDTQSFLVLSFKKEHLSVSGA
jgi:hypothetical protein